MLRKTKPFAALALAACLALLPGPASAEYFLDVYSGGNITQQQNFKGNATQPDMTKLDLRIKSVNFDSSFLIGARGGAWFERYPFLGLGLDVLFYQPDTNRQQSTIISSGTGVIGDFATLSSTDRSTIINGIDVKVLSVSLQAMLRFQALVSDTFPRGQLQPYIFAGPALFFTQGERSNTSTDLGYNVGAGFRWKFTRDLGLLAEYRFTHFSPTLEFESAGSQLKLKSDFDSHYLIVGLTFTF